MTEPGIPLRNPLTTAERRVVLGLWALPGIGPRRISAFLEGFSARGFEALLGESPLEVLERIQLSPNARARLANLPALDQIADEVLRRVRAAGMSVAFMGDAAYPARLAEIGDAPPLLFHLGQPGPTRPRVGMVGSRLPEGGVVARTRRWAQRIAEAGIGVVSGGAEGIDWASHRGALDGQGETWAFLGSALDCLDARRQTLAKDLLRGGGVLFSELPPGVAASRSTFPRRNRLISGASDAVWVVRASARSGTLHTAAAALAQGRTLLATSGDPEHAASAGGVALLESGQAQRCDSEVGVFEALGVKRPASRVADLSGLSADLSSGAAVTYRCIDPGPVTLDALLVEAGLEPRALVSALMELELRGLAVQHPGRVYERV